ncbi:hypothetical protein [Acinetobacter sp. ASP199]|uniref:hypothetical protein n=1 Tax=unclassified Acinetobacter TaxID=196816 RepID=UPI001F617F3F|nr:hypothetical protein [Acinetobacter sp. ASP199]UNT58349.1 hypothetical protein IHE35_09410 [Acinetobacter sp. ASP199]
MIQKNISVQDQYGVAYHIQATLQNPPSISHSPLAYIQYIDVDGELIRPNFDMCFQSQINGKIYRISKLIE